jgi:hypothetical protein
VIALRSNDGAMRLQSTQGHPVRALAGDTLAAPMSAMGH